MADPQAAITTAEASSSTTDGDLLVAKQSSSVTVKPGYKTSEFWLKLAAVLLTALYASDVIPTGGPVSKVAAIAATMLGAIGYTVVRGMVKAGAS